MRAGVHHATFPLLWRGARVGIASRALGPTTSGGPVWSTGTRHGYGFDSGSGKCYHAEHGTGSRFEKAQSHDLSGSAPAAKGDTIRLTLDFAQATLAVEKNGRWLGVMCCGAGFRQWLPQNAACCWAVELWNSAVQIESSLGR
jgi:hypothetical protein